MQDNTGTLNQISLGICNLQCKIKTPGRGVHCHPKTIGTINIGSDRAIRFVLQEFLIVLLGKFGG